MGQPCGRREEPDQPVVAGRVDDDRRNVGKDHAAEVERGQQDAEPLAEAARPGQQLQEQGSHHDDVGADERRPDVAQDHGLPDVGVEVLHTGENRTDQWRADCQLHRGQLPAEWHPEGDADQEDRQSGGQPGDGLGTGTRVQDPLEEEDGDVGGGSDPGPEQQRTGDQDLGVGPGEDVPQLVECRPGPLLAIGLRSERGGRCLADQEQHRDAHRHHDHRRHLEGQVPGGGIVLLPGGDDRALDSQAGQRAEHGRQEQGFDPPAPSEHLGHHGNVGQGEDGRRLACDEDHQHQEPIAADHGEHPRGDAHHHEAAGHVGRTAAHPAAGPVAQPAGHRIGDPAEQPVCGEGEGDRQCARRPLLHVEGDQDPGDGQIGPGAHQSDRQADEAAHPGGIDAPDAFGAFGAVRTEGRIGHRAVQVPGGGCGLVRWTGDRPLPVVGRPVHPSASVPDGASGWAGVPPLAPADEAASAPARCAPSICT